MHDNNLYIVFGAKPPFTFLQESEQIIHSSEWTDYQLKHKVKLKEVCALDDLSENQMGTCRCYGASILVILW